MDDENTRNTTTSMDEPPLKKNRPVSEFVMGDSKDEEEAAPIRKEGIIMSGIDSSQPLKEITYKKYEKNEQSYGVLKKALLANDFIRNLLDDDRMNSVIEAMQPEEYSADDFIIREGETGSHLYVSDVGSFEVIKSGKSVKKFGAGEVFGELAILYKAKRFASIKATSNARVWVLDRKVFQKIMVRSGKQEQEDNVRFLSSVPLLKDIHGSNLVKVSDFLKREFFAAGTMIVRQGEHGDKFYIIRGGTVIITKRLTDTGPDQFVNELSRGDYFGEQALLHEDRRLATVTAKAPGVECLTMERVPFNEFMGGIEDLKGKNYTSARPSNLVKRNQIAVTSEYEKIKLEDLEIVGTLGVGAFGRVELVQYGKNRTQTFALKRLKKVEVLYQQQQEHVFSEKSIMFRCNSPFICKLYRTYKDNKHLFLLMEPILGGDVWTILQKKGHFNEQVARFMSACVVEAFEHIHNLDIVYRDLKPENLMLDSRGYVKLVDFGYAKYLSSGSKTYTFAGTPEYVAPEVILGNGHDRAADYWTLGILIHELLVGKPPFRGTNQVKTYNLIIRGIDAIEFTSKIPKVAQPLIRKLCRSFPTERLGYLRNGIKDIKNHRWYMGFDWDKLREGKMTAPLIRPIKDHLDLTNFDKYEKYKMPPDETSGWDIDF
ncbi:cGMP-dependent protein kinase, isozyme 1-like isoform X2 [Arctopsyche grandis]